jgi:large subunit ribosomal protein L9
MEIILRQAVENLGKPGDVVKVKPGYARNYLLPRGLAYEATPGNLKRIQQERDRLEAAESARRDTAQGLAEKFEQVSLTFSARVGEEGKLFGSVTAADIAQQLEAQGFTSKSDRSTSMSRSKPWACTASRFVFTPTSSRRFESGSSNSRALGFWGFWVLV